MLKIQCWWDLDIAHAASSIPLGGRNCPSCKDEMWELAPF